MTLQERIASYYGQPGMTDRAVLDEIRKDPSFFKDCTAVQAADRCSVSRATFLRAIRKTGIESFSALKYLCSKETEQPEKPKADSMEQVLRSYESILNQLLLHSSFKKQAAALLEARKIYLYGTGNEQKSIVRYLKYRLLCAGLLAEDLFDEGETDFAMKEMGPDDLFIAVSLSGASSSLMSLIQKLNGPKIMSLTRLRDNPLAAHSDLRLYVSTASVFGGEYELVGAFYVLIDLLTAELQSLISGKQDSTHHREGLAASFQARMAGRLAQMSDTDQYIARALFRNQSHLIASSITVCAENLHVSPSALSRFASRLGYSGFGEMRAAALDSSDASGRKEAGISWFRGYQMMFSLLREADLSSFFERLSRNGRIFFISLYSRHASLASEMYRMFLSCQRVQYHYAGQEAIRHLPEFVDDMDTVFILAPEGSDERSLHLLQNCALSRTCSCVLTRFESFVSSVQPDLLVQAPGTSVFEDEEILGPFYVLAELIYIRYRIYLNEHLFKV